MDLRELRLDERASMKEVQTADKERKKKRGIYNELLDLCLFVSTLFFLFTP